MEATYYTLILVKDSHGNKAYNVAEDMSDVISLHGLVDEDGSLLHFESEAHGAYLLHSDGCTVVTKRINLDFDKEFEDLIADLNKRSSSSTF